MQAMALVREGDVEGLRKLVAEEEAGNLLALDNKVRALSGGAGLLHWITEVPEESGGKALMEYVLAAVGLSGEGSAHESAASIVWGADDMGALVTHWAALSDAEFAIKALLAERVANVYKAKEGEAAVDAQDSAGESALHYASLNGSMRVFSALIESGAAVNLQSDSGQCALHAAASNKKGEVIGALIDAGANLSIKDANGKTAVDIASAFKDEDLMAYFNAEKRRHAEKVKELEERNRLLEERLATEDEVKRGLQNKLAKLYHDLAKAETAAKGSEATMALVEEQRQEIIALKEERHKMTEKVQTLETMFKTALQQNTNVVRKTQVLEQEKAALENQLDVQRKELAVKSTALQEIEGRFQELEEQFEVRVQAASSAAVAAAAAAATPVLPPIAAPAVVEAKETVAMCNEETLRLRKEYEHGLFRQLRETINNLQTLTTLTTTALRDTTKQLDLVLDEGAAL
mmetsp:Transcript_2056/g.7451  ORF Transcript_2056/g.7451 Transcript_2056/m.7451 type:complete len:462 (+) Transcript_2056:60-1445(+)